jgi:hypothetical protein
MDLDQQGFNIGSRVVLNINMLPKIEGQIISREHGNTYKILFDSELNIYGRKSRDWVVLRDNLKLAMREELL